MLFQSLVVSFLSITPQSWIYRQLGCIGSSIFTRDNLLSQQFSVPLIPDMEPAAKGLLLQRSEADGNLEIYLMNNSSSKQRPFRFDFCSPRMLKRGKIAQGEILRKACGNSRTIFDFTAGCGRDSFVLASAGLRTYLFEKNPIIFAMLQEAWVRLCLSDPSVACRMQLFNVDATTLRSQDFEIESLSDGFSVYIDIMYEDVGNRKSLAKKDIQILRLVLNSDYNSATEFENTEMLFNAACRIATDRIVVKRRINAPPMVQHVQPHASITGRTHRYDIYMMNRLVAQR
jgi:16S rRNA (guanine1516-N2)-methyltransferase